MLLTGADLTIADIDGETALHMAARIGDTTIIQSLLNRMAIQPNADLNAVNKNDQTALLVILDEMVSNKEYRLPASVCIALIEAGHNDIYARCDS